MGREKDPTPSTKNELSKESITARQKLESDWWKANSELEHFYEQQRYKANNPLATELNPITRMSRELGLKRGSYFPSLLANKKTKHGGKKRRIRAPRKQSRRIIYKKK